MSTLRRYHKSHNAKFCIDCGFNISVPSASLAPAVSSVPRAAANSKGESLLPMFSSANVPLSILPGEGSLPYHSYRLLGIECLDNKGQNGPHIIKKILNQYPYSDDHMWERPAVVLMGNRSIVGLSVKDATSLWAKTEQYLEDTPSDHWDFKYPKQYYICQLPNFESDEASHEGQ